MLPRRLLPPCIVEGRNPLAKLGSSGLVWVGLGRVGLSGSINVDRVYY